MDTLIDIGLRNAVLALPIAALALLLGVAIRRPALIHLLWVIVLLRLVLPPLWTVTVPRPSVAGPRPAEETSAAEARADVNAVTSFDTPLPLAPAAEPARWWQPTTVDPAVFGPVSFGEPEIDLSAIELEVAPTVGPLSARQRWRDLAALAWVAGSLAAVLISWQRLGWFMRLLSGARLAPDEVQRQAGEIACRMGLARAPRVLLIDARVSPMLWGFYGRPRLIVPAALWQRLEGTRRSALLAHEIAHYRRGDHLVRWLELVATVLFWWQPVVWLARRWLRETEEQCCDAWVIWAMPDGRRDYATAIVDTVGFLSEGRSVLPALASGVGQVPQLHRRLTMIMRESTPRRLPRIAVALLLGGGLTIGTLAPTWAQPQPKEDPRAKPTKPGDAPRPDREERDAERRRDAAERREAAERRRDQSDRPRPPEDEGAAAVNRARAEFEEARAAMQKAQAQMERAARQMEEVQQRFARNREMDRPRDPRPANEARPGAAPRGPGGGGDRAPAPPGGGGVEQRVAAVERALEQVTRQLDEIRREMQRSRGPGFGGFPGGRGGPGGPGAPGGGAGARPVGPSGRGPDGPPDSPRREP